MIVLADCLLGVATQFTGFYFSYLKQQILPCLWITKGPPRGRYGLQGRAKRSWEAVQVSSTYRNSHQSTGLTWILPGTRLSEVVNISCLALDVSGDARITFPVPAPSGLVRMNCCLEDPEASTAVTIWIFCPVCWSVTIYKIQHASPFVWCVFRSVHLHLHPQAVLQEVITRINAGLR